MARLRRRWTLGRLLAVVLASALGLSLARYAWLPAIIVLAGLLIPIAAEGLTWGQVAVVLAGAFLLAGVSFPPARPRYAGDNDPLSSPARRAAWYRLRAAQFRSGAADAIAAEAKAMRQADASANAEERERLRDEARRWAWVAEERAGSAMEMDNRARVMDRARW